MTHRTSSPQALPIKSQWHTFTDGPCIGLQAYIEWYADTCYYPVPLSSEETAALVIDESCSWRGPDAVYRRLSDGNFYYSHTVRYAPT